MGDDQRAIDELAALAALDPDSTDRAVALGLAHARARRYDAAVLTLSRAVERFPDEPQIYAALGRVWLEAAEVREDSTALKKAAQALSTAAAHERASSATLTDLARVSLLLGDTGGAERAARQAIARTPVQPDAYRQLATIAAARGHIHEARDALISYVALAGHVPGLASIATQIATYSVRLGDRAVALRWIQRALQEGGSAGVLSPLRRRAERLREEEPQGDQGEQGEN
jgi:Flp pilus assembly protein TadD